MTNKTKKLRALWGTTPILNIINNSKAERLLGIESHTLVFKTYYITDGFDFNFSRFCHFKLFHLIIAWLVFPYFAVRYDIFHFYADRGILPTRRWKGIHPFELWVLKKLRKKIFIYTYGGDVRTQVTTKDLGKFNCCMECPSVRKACVCDEDLHQKNSARLKRYADEIFSMGDMSEYLPESNKALFFWPIDLESVSLSQDRAESSKPLKIVHAPNHRHFKGTVYLEAAVKRLKSEGFEIELVLVEKQSNMSAREIYREADIVAEQFIIGWHGFTAIEAMAYGKPVVAYIRKKEYLLAPEECPIVSASPDDLVYVLRDLIQDEEKRKHLGGAGRAYVEKHYSLDAFADRLRSVYARHGLVAIGGDRFSLKDSSPGKNADEGIKQELDLIAGSDQAPSASHR